MYLPVEAHGALVPEGSWEGPVVSVFSRAFNVLHPSGVLVGVVASRRQMSPFALVSGGCFHPEGGGTPAARIATGSLCRRAGDGLLVSGIRLDLSASSLWEGRLPPRLAGTIRDVSSLAPLLISALAEAGADDGLREVVVPRPSQTIFGRRAREVLASVRSGSLENPGSLRGLSSLVGLGIGFTPSGDDFLSGVLLAREMTGPTGPSPGEDEIRSKLDRTNAGGRTLLTAALAHRFPAYLLEFAGEIAAAEEASSAGVRDAERRVQSAVRSAATHGETSGTDSVTGFTWYLSLLGRGAHFV